MTLRDELLQATRVPRVPLFSSLVAGLQMAGFKVVPDSLWDELGDALLGFEEDWSALEMPFRLHENHQRSNCHEVWQFRLGYELVEEGVTTWVIPVEELLCLASGDPEYEDFVQITRFTFRGDYPSMLGAVAKLIDALKEER
jgi:hypothetical protein